MKTHDLHDTSSPLVNVISSFVCDVMFQIHPKLLKHHYCCKNTCTKDNKDNIF